MNISVQPLVNFSIKKLYYNQKIFLLHISSYSKNNKLKSK